jgi:hypothetical protein
MRIRVKVEVFEDVVEAESVGDAWTLLSQSLFTRLRDGSALDVVRLDAECQNCGKCWPLDELNEVDDLSERVSAGEVCPAGECPDCGSLCTPIAGGVC